LNGDESYGWGFSTTDPTDARYGDDPTKHALDASLEVFVREVLQNSNDQGLQGETVEVHFWIDRVTGDELAAFQDAIEWEALVEEHLHAIPEDHGRGIRQFLQKFEEREELLLLTVEDRNTTGLTGGEAEDKSNYTALVRDVLYSEKQDDRRSGGSYGLGKSVLWSSSGISTVLFASNLHEDPDDRRSPRLIGRSQLPTHKSDEPDEIYQGAGWFGDLDAGGGQRPLSVWGLEAEALAEELRIPRAGIPGTSATVVGFRDPRRETDLGVDELADEIVENAVTFFWPAIHFGDLRVVVHTDEYDREAKISEVPAVRPFVDCLRRRADADQELVNPGDVASEEIDVEMPDREKDGETLETTDGPVELAVRLAKEGDVEEWVNHVALFRGAGMVVRYYDRERIVLGKRDFHAVLVAGEARPLPGEEPTEADLDIEEFLRASEPPAHDDWESRKATVQQKNDYRRGALKAVKELKDGITDALRRLVQKSPGRGQMGPKRLAKRFPVGRGRRASEPDTQRLPAFEGERALEFDPTESRWRFYGRLQPIEEDHRGWEATVQLQRMAEDGPTRDRIPIADLEVEPSAVDWDIEDGVARLSVEEGIGTVELRGTTNRDRQWAETRMEIESTIELGGG